MPSGLRRATTFFVRIAHLYLKNSILFSNLSLYYVNKIAAKPQFNVESSKFKENKP
jgi:hypothetical protein